MAAPTRLSTAEFERTRRAYMKVSKRDLATVLNTKAFFIARRSVIETPKADKRSIQTSLGKIIKRKKGGVTLKLAKAEKRNISLAEAIIRARAHRAGRSQPSKGEIGRLIESLLAARMRSVAFLKSGWLAAIKALQPFAEKRGAPRMESSVKQYGKPKGSAKPAREGSRPVARIVNEALARGDKGALQLYGLPALQRAFDFETASMKEYMARKLRDGAKRLGIRTT